MHPTKRSSAHALPHAHSGEDDAPPLTRGFFKTAEIREGSRLIRRGRPSLEHPKITISIRFGADLLDALRATGPGW